VPTENRLLPAYPNPFNPTTTIGFAVLNATPLTITVTDLLGKEVASLAKGQVFSAGRHVIQFNAEYLTSGTYLVRMEAGDFVQTRQITLLK